MLRTRVTELLGIDHPVVLGGMGSGTNPELVAAVSEAGGLGILGASGLSPDQIRDSVRAIRERTRKPFGVNFLVFLTRFEQLDAALEAGVPVISTAWGDAGEWLRRARAGGARTMHMVPSVEEARRATEWAVDVIVAQGTEGGGHVGHVASTVLVPGVVDAVAPVPVLAAGGFADGRGLAAALALGAEGVLMGTRFLATPEAPVPSAYKAAIVEAGSTDTLFTRVPDLAQGVAWPGAWGRVVSTPGVAEWVGREDEVSRLGQTLYRRFAAARQTNDRDGMVIFAGQSSGLIHAQRPAADIVREIVAEAERILRGRLPGLLA